MFSRRPSFATTVSWTLMALCLVTTAACRNSDAGYPMAESRDVEPQSAPAPCSERLRPLADMAMPPPEATTGDVESALREGFGARHLTAVAENVSILPGDGDSSPVLRVHYPKGSIAFSAARKGAPLGGAAFYVPAGQLAGGEALCLRYRVRFPDGFAFAKGGKLPGLYGGEAPSGGESVTGENGWSVRLMWRRDGAGELYEYIVNKKGKFGLSVGRGLFDLPRGRWLAIALEVIPNDTSQANGVARLWVDGKPVIEQNDIIFGTDGRDAVAGLMFSTFFGGSGRSWASPKDQHVDFSDFKIFRSGD